MKVYWREFFFCLRFGFWELCFLGVFLGSMNIKNMVIIFIDNLVKEVSFRDIRDVFEEYGWILDVYILRK